MATTLNLGFNAVQFDLNAFEQQIQSVGIKCKHSRAMLCPIGLKDRTDVAGHEDHSGCQGGFLYEDAGEVTVLFHSNNAQKMIESLGEVDSSLAYASFPLVYDDNGKEIFVAMYDRLSLLDQDVWVVEQQLVESNRTGIDRLHYEAVSIEHIIDSTGKKYLPTDYEILDGCIKWVGNRPGIDPKTGKGVVYSVRYHYRPYWIIKNLSKEIRIMREDDSGGRSVVRGPKSVIIQREFAFRNEYRSSKSNNDSARNTYAPADGSFGVK